MAKKHDPSWQLDLRPITRRTNGSKPSAPPPPPPAPEVEQARLLTQLQQTIDELREEVSRLGARVGAVEGAIREASAPQSGNVEEMPRRRLREVKPPRRISPVASESRGTHARLIGDEEATGG